MKSGVMSPKYLCFISYASPNKDFVDDLGEALGKELERYVRGKGLFIDNKRIMGGDFPDEAIRQAMCKSVCMIIVYTPSYFTKDFTYCTREFKGMEKLEEHRLPIISDPELKTHGLIIPVVFRGSDHIPEEIKRKRCLYDFSNYYSCYKRISKHPKYSRKITELAEYIYSIYLIYNDKNIFEECEKFELPSDADVIPWLKDAATPRPIFPGRRS